MIDSFDLGNGFRLRIWSHTDYFEPDEQFPTLYYDVYHDTAKVVPATWIGQDCDQPFSFNTAFADGGQLACVYGEEGKWVWDFLVVDLRTHESWPRHRHHDEAGNKIPNGRWADRFQRLARENPGIPQLQKLRE